MNRAGEPEFQPRGGGVPCSSKVIALPQRACTSVIVKDMLRVGAIVLSLLFTSSPTPAAERLFSDLYLSGILQALGQPRADGAALAGDDRASLPAAHVALEPKEAERPLSGPLAMPHGYIIETWQTEQGLPQNTVTSIAQTRDGYLWIGTLNGLARFDGVQFKVFSAARALPSWAVRASGTCLATGKAGFGSRS